MLAGTGLWEKPSSAHGLFTETRVPLVGRMHLTRVAQGSCAVTMQSLPKSPLCSRLSRGCPGRCVWGKTWSQRRAQMQNGFLEGTLNLESRD